MKLNEKNFIFYTETQKLKPDIIAQFEECKLKKKKDEFDKMFISVVKQKMKETRLKLVVTHLPTKIKKSWTLGKDEVDRETLMKEVVQLVRITRDQAKRTIKRVSKQFDGAKYETIGGVLTKPGMINEIGKHCTTNDPLAEKKPRKPKSHYVGIELECNALPGHNTSTVAKAFVQEGLARYVQIGEDGSCGGTPGVKGLEVRCLLEESTFVETLTKICTLIRKLGFKVDASCGTHVHLDMRNRDVKNSYANLFRVQLLLRKFLSFHRKRNIYCVKNSYETYDLHVQHAVGRDSRRCGINTHSYDKYKTLEVRMHQGTLDETKLIPWIKFLLKVVNHSDKVEKTVHTLKQAQAVFKVEDQLFQDLSNRLKSRGA